MRVGVNSGEASSARSADTAMSPIHWSATRSIRARVREPCARRRRADRCEDDRHHRGDCCREAVRLADQGRASWSTRTSSEGFLAHQDQGRLRTDALNAEVRRRREPVDAGEAEVRAQASRTASTNLSARRGANRSSHHAPSTCTRACPGRSVARCGRRAVPKRSAACTSPSGASPGKELPDQVEHEQAPEEAAIPDDRIEWGNDATEGAGQAVRPGSLTSTYDEAFPSTPSRSTGRGRRVRRACRESVRPWVTRPPRIRLRGPDAAEDVADDCRHRANRVRGTARGAVPDSLPVGARGEARRQEQPSSRSYPTVPVAPREAEHAGDGIRLEHRADGVRWQPEPVGRCPALALEVECRQRAVCADPLEHPLGHIGVFDEGSRCVQAQESAEPGELARRYKGETLVVRLEDLPAFVQLVAPNGVVVGDSRMQHQVVAPARDGKRVELDRPEVPEDFQHGVGGPSSDRAGVSRWCATR